MNMSRQQSTLPRIRRKSRRVVRTTRRTISEHIFSSVGVCLGLGFGAGLLLGISLADAVERSRHESYGRHLLDTVAHAAPEWLGGKS